MLCPLTVPELRLKVPLHPGVLGGHFITHRLTGDTGLIVLKEMWAEKHH